jgi:ankyrin repeat protein
MDTDQSVFEIVNTAAYQQPTKESTALFNAALAGSSAGVVNAIKAGGKVNYYHRPEAQQCALHVAAEAGSLAVVEALLENGALVNILAATNKDMPLALAAAGGHNKVVDLLLAKGADVHHQNAYGNTALMMAAKHHASGCVKALLAAGSNIHAKNNKGSTPLLLACYEEDLPKGMMGGVQLPPIFKQLVDAGADVNCVDKRGATPLLAACAGGIEELIVFLLDAGANPKVKEEGGLGPVAMAEFHKKKLRKVVSERLQ